jgi:hypothetical protein
MPEEITPETAPVFDATALDDAALSAEFARVTERGQALAAQAEHTAEEAAEFATLAERLPVLQTETQARIDRATAQQAQRDAFSNVTVPVIPTVAPTAPLTAPVAAEEPAPVSQSVSVPSVAEMAAQSPAPVTPTRTTDLVRAELSATAAGLLGMRPGDEFSGNNTLGMALIKNAQSFGLRGAPGQRQTMAQFRRTRREDQIVDTLDGQETQRILRDLRRERHLHGGNLAKAWQHSIDQGASLTAAAGWCAPSQNDYDLCTNWSGSVGFLDAPTVTVTRGGINYTDEPTFPEIYANAIAAGGGSNFLTEAQVIADTPKTCSEIPCPTFENRRLDVMALCIRVSFLQAAGYPEVVDAWENGLRAAHEAEMNRIIIADIIARAGAATVVTPVDPDGTDSFTAALLSGVGLAAEDIRYRFHMAWDATVEIVLPHWVLEQVRSDLRRRSGDTGNLLSVSDSYIASLFSVLNVRVQFVRGWQDGLITGGALNPAFPGGDAATPFMLALPNTVSFLAYPAGSVQIARQDVVTLTNVYDAASLAVNEFTSLFAEEGFAPIYPCPGQRLYTITGCTGGTTGAHVIDCTDAA